MHEFDYASGNDWSWWGADWASADYSGQGGFNSLAPGDGGDSAWMRRLCPLTVKAPPHIVFSPILPSPPSPTLSRFSPILSSTMSTSPTSPTSSSILFPPITPTSSSILFSPIQSPTMSTRYSSDTNVHIDEDGFNTMIKWTFVGRGGQKTKESADKTKESADKHIGMTNMRTKEESIQQSCFQIVLKSRCQLCPISLHIKR